jgi:hypothetical protein
MRRGAGLTGFHLPHLVVDRGAYVFKLNRIRSLLKWAACMAKRDDVEVDMPLHCRIQSITMDIF